MTRPSRRSTTALGPNCYLQDLFTSETTRGRGIGRALIPAASEVDVGRGEVADRPSVPLIGGNAIKQAWSGRRSNDQR
jgi:GNAT superfamily N-acetyltransferase